MTVRELESAPSMAALYPRAVAGLGRALLRRGDGAATLPDEELALSGVEIDRERLAAYDRVCTFEVSDRLPPTYPHVLAFPLSMSLMTAGEFPFPVMGLVHVANRIVQRRPISADERLDLRVRTASLEPHERGTQFQALAEAATGGERVWESANTYLRREGGGSSPDRKKPGAAEPATPSASLSVPADTGRRYAAVSGDRNPIHLHRLTARLFGMPRPIAHGMWLKARVLAMLAPLLPDAYAVEVRFKLPVQMPAKLSLSSSAEGAARQVAVHDAGSGKPHLTGEITPV